MCTLFTISGHNPAFPAANETQKDHIVGLNTYCEGICYVIYARCPGIMKEFLPVINSITNAQARGIYCYYKDRPTCFNEIYLCFYEVTQTRKPPYCFECMITLIKADDFTTNIQ